MKYVSKKDENIIASLDSTNEKYGTATLIYLTGENAGKSFSITTSTLKRWWKATADSDVETSNNPLHIDMEQVNTPYKPDVVPHYIPKPQSVIDYENKSRGKKLNTELPVFEVIVETFAELLSKINETSKYVKFKDGTTLWRKSSCIDIYATEHLFEPLTKAGLTSAPNKDKARPFAYHIETKEDFELAREVIINNG